MLHIYQIPESGLIFLIITNPFPIIKYGLLFSTAPLFQSQQLLKKYLKFEISFLNPHHSSRKLIVQKLSRRNMAGSVVSSSLATLPPRSQIIYKKSTCHRPIGLHGSVLSSSQRSLYRPKQNQVAKIVTKSRRYGY